MSKLVPAYPHTKLLRLTCQHFALHNYLVCCFLWVEGWYWGGAKVMRGIVAMCNNIQLEIPAERIF